jgi:glutamate 5-kinase
MGLHSTQIHEALGYADSEYVAVRENIAFEGRERSRPTTPDYRASERRGNGVVEGESLRSRSVETEP